MNFVYYSIQNSGVSKIVLFEIIILFIIDDIGQKIH